ncbi:hypothetical protein DVH24_001498 [Malus domestica]|uniref:Uncharacterized protein n=1 Tax=Malus domestica TaxID=3750 RepID=A0A498K4R6_MALDO|nr:hypothetical protein DVH24_001498 [Malus domestica]
MLQGKSLKIKSRNGSMDFSYFLLLEAVDVSDKNRSNPNLYTLVNFGAETKITKGFTAVANNKNVYAFWCKFDHY